ncbi:unnamed protein product [Rotaria sp. Silwood2]|nr:unnamed protein product [Rotaria sp. Silwood2]CAF2560674.1 unnamed protein product [Rotaria sp. Silwood2]CAF2974391.1 unnamed protein product [Rotaria sp. Silwood2]CAF4370317.1 unnamed protein product [Rotaria sp. Silwood2]CAF4433294.1 unnamed protein product [Rotaria sp. Silwood2]
MDNIKNAAKAVEDKKHEMMSRSSAEYNKEKAKDSNNTIGERVGAGIDYCKDKIEEGGHAVSKEINKQKAIH